MEVFGVVGGRFECVVEFGCGGSGRVGFYLLL